MKRFLTHLIFFIDGFPLCIKGERIDKVHDSVTGDFIKDFRDLTVCTLPNPAVDVLHCAVIKRRTVDSGIIVVYCGLKKFRADLKPVSIPKPYGICHMNLQLVLLWKF